MINWITVKLCPYCGTGYPLLICDGIRQTFRLACKDANLHKAPECYYITDESPTIEEAAIKWDNLKRK